MQFRPIKGYEFLHRRFIKDYIATNLINSLFGVVVIYLAGYFYVKMKGVHINSFPLYILISPIIFLILAVLTIGQFEFREKLKNSKKVFLEIDENYLQFQDEKKKTKLKWDQITGLTKSKFLSDTTDYFVFYKGGKVRFDNTFINEEDLKKYEVIINREKVFLKNGNSIYKLSDKNLEIKRPHLLIEKYSEMKFN